jgi:drug/metabolite transporter (DMT)-like permease
MRLPRAAGLLLGLAGVLVLMLGRGAAFDVQSLLPVLAMLGATACYGWSGHMARRWLPGLPPLVTATGSLFSGAVLVTPLALLLCRHSHHHPWCGARSGLALGCTSLAYLIFYRLIDRLGATRASSVTYLVPVFGVLWGLVSARAGGLADAAGRAADSGRGVAAGLAASV